MLTNQQQQDPQSEDLNFTAFTDLCRFCSLRLGAKINLFDKEAEHRQLLFKVRTFLPTAVCFIYIMHCIICISSLYQSPVRSLISDIERWFPSEKDLWTMCCEDRSDIWMAKYLHSNRYCTSKLCWIDESRYSHNKFSGM